MGYALFANRKIFYTAVVNSLQLQLDQISQKRMDLANYSMSIADGVVSSDEVLNDLGNSDQYMQYFAGLEQFQNANPATITDANGNQMDIGTYYYGANATPEQKVYAEQQYQQGLAEQYSKNISQQISKLDNELEMQQKRVETKLTAAEKQLEAVEQAEAQAIDRATPHYAGLG